MNLPKKYFSFTQFDTWNKSKKLYREIYYENKPRFETKESLFGKHTAKMLEENTEHPILSKVPRLQKSEYRIETTIEGIPILAFLDSCTKKTGSFIEYKTGHTLWDQPRVDAHNQLPFYCMCLKAHLGLYDPHTLLTWLETRLVEESDVIGGVTFHKPPLVEFTGKISVFTRHISPFDIEEITNQVVLSANAIEQDYKTYKENQP